MELWKRTVFAEEKGGLFNSHKPDPKNCCSIVGNSRWGEINLINIEFKSVEDKRLFHQCLSYLLVIFRLWFEYSIIIALYSIHINTRIWICIARCSEQLHSGTTSNDEQSQILRPSCSPMPLAIAKGQLPWLLTVLNLHCSGWLYYRIARLIRQPVSTVWAQRAGLCLAIPNSEYECRYNFLFPRCLFPINLFPCLASPQFQKSPSEWWHSHWFIWLSIYPYFSSSQSTGPFRFRWHCTASPHIEFINFLAFTQKPPESTREVPVLLWPFYHRIKGCSWRWCNYPLILRLQATRLCCVRLDGQKITYWLFGVAIFLVLYDRVWS